MNLFNGLCAFPITPADADGRVDAVALRALLSRLVAAEVDSIGLLGSTGTFLYLERAERRRAIQVAVDHVAGRLPVMVGIGALRTDDAVALGLDARAAGADAVLLAPVSYTKLTEDEVFAHFETVAAAVALPLCIYNNPGTTNFAFTPDLVSRLSRVANIAALKTPAPEQALLARDLRDWRAAVPAEFSLGYSTDWNAAEAMLAGGDAWHSVLAGLLPDLAMRIVTAARAADEIEVRRLDARLKPLWELFIELGSLRVVYAAASLLGICEAAPPRPILALPEAARARVATALGLVTAE